MENTFSVRPTLPVPGPITTNFSRRATQTWRYTGFCEQMEQLFPGKKFHPK